MKRLMDYLFIHGCISGALAGAAAGFVGMGFYVAAVIFGICFAIMLTDFVLWKSAA